MVLLIASLGYLLSGVWIFRQRQHRPSAARLALLYCSLSLAWALEQALRAFGQLDRLAPELLDIAQLYGSFLLAVTLLFLTRSLFSSKDRPTLWARIGIAALVILGVALTGFIAFPEQLPLPAGRTLERVEARHLAAIGGWAVFMGTTALLTIQALRRSSRYSTLIPYWAILLTLVIIGNGLLFADQASLGNLFHLASAVLMAYVIGARRLPSIGHISRRSLGLAFYVAAALGIYGGAFTLAQIVFKDWDRLNPLWVGMGAASILVFLLNPLLNRIQKRIESWSIQKAQDPTGMLRQYSQSITHILDLNKLATLAVGTASEFLGVQHGYLFLVDAEKNGEEHRRICLRGVRGMGEVNPESGKFSEESPFVAYFREEYKPLSQFELDQRATFRSMPSEERQWLSGLDVEIYVPIYAKNEWIGLLALGPKRSGAEYTPQDLNLLSTLADQTAVALENTRLVEGLMRLNNEFRRAYSALDQANRHLERLDKTKSDFISIASHELRTPLTLISGASQMLLDDPDIQQNEYYKQLLSKMHAGTVRLHEIVDTMLDMAKIDSRALTLEPQPISLSSLIRSVCNELKKDHEARKQTITLENLDELPSITADMVALQKVFHHLVINAIKYTPDGGKITISGRELPPNASDMPIGGVEITVSDTGIGIDPRYHELIFAKFYQTGELELHSSGKTKFKGGGPGLGLAIAKGIVEAHHGRIWVESPGYDEVKCPGSQFHVVLPLRPTDRPAAPVSATFSL